MPSYIPGLSLDSGARRKMRASAARMAAEGNEIAPLVPTNNPRSARIPQKAQPKQMMGGQPQAMMPQRQPQPARTSTMQAATAPQMQGRPGGMTGAQPFDASMLDFGMPRGAPPTRPTAPSYNGTTTDAAAIDFGGGGMNGTTTDPLPLDPVETHDLYENALRELLQGGPRDTSGDEALVRELMASEVGQGQADLNARLGAAGFGTSGALGAMSGDLRAKAARDAAEQIMGIRDDARDDHFRDLNLGMSQWLGSDQHAQRTALLDAYLKALNDEGDPDEIPGANPNAPPGTPGGQMGGPVLGGQGTYNNPTIIRPHEWVELGLEPVEGTPGMFVHPETGLYYYVPQTGWTWGTGLDPDGDGTIFE